MTIPQLAPEEPLSPELVLVLPPELRAQALAALGPPVRPLPRLRLAAPLEPEPMEESVGHAVGRLLAGRFLQLGVIFFTATVITVALSLVAQAVASR